MFAANRRDGLRDQVISCQMLCPTKEMEVRAETEDLAYREAIDFESPDGDW